MICKGQILRGAKGVYELLHPLKGTTVFKAKVVSSTSVQAQWAVVKTATTDVEKMCLRREHCNYSIPEVATSPHIRAMCDTIHLNSHGDIPSCLVFEWMDQDLRSLRRPEFRANPNLPKAVSQGVLHALKVLKTLDAIHTDVNPNNIYITGIESGSPVAKLGDLGNMIKDGSVTQRCQSLPCRAPEVWEGHPCRHASDVWSLAVTLTTLSSPLILFGAGDKIVEGQTEAWCIAKIMRLVGPLREPVNNDTYKEEFELAKVLEMMDHPGGPAMKLITRQNWRFELESIPDPPVPRDLLDFIEAILVIDPGKRPTAAQALLHPYLQSLMDV